MIEQFLLYSLETLINKTIATIFECTNLEQSNWLLTIYNTSLSVQLKTERYCLIIHSLFLNFAGRETNQHHVGKLFYAEY